MSEIDILSQQVATTLLENKLRLVTAESCTGGWLAKCLTDIAGSSQWFAGGFIPYSDEAKQQMLEVQASTLESLGAVSEETVTEMARGVLANSSADVSVAVSGIAGPDGAVEGKPVGTVCFAWMVRDGMLCSSTQHFQGDRRMVRRESVCYGLQGILDVLKA